MSNEKPQLIVLGSIDTIKGNPGMLKEGSSRKNHSDPDVQEMPRELKKTGVTARKAAKKTGAARKPTRSR